MAWINVLPVTELPEGARRVVRSAGKAILLVHQQGQIFACNSSCPHMGFPLEFATITSDCGIICALHHSAFDLRSGDVKDWSPWPPVFGPMFAALSRKKYLPTYKTKVEANAIWLDL